MNRRFNLAENENPDQNQQENQPRMGAGFFVIMMLAFPLQYYLTDSYGGIFSTKLSPLYSNLKSVSEHEIKMHLPLSKTRDTLWRIT